MRYNFSLNYSPNFSTPKRSLSKVKFIIIHYTGMKSENKAINRLTDVNSKVSCHYFIKKLKNRRIKYFFILRLYMKSFINVNE